MKQYNERVNTPSAQTGASPSQSRAESRIKVQPADEALRCEYVEVNNYLRHYSSLRFVIFSVYFAVMAAVVAVAFGAVQLKTNSLAWIVFSMRFLGLLTTAAFLVYELRLEGLIRYYQACGKTLDGRLGLRQMEDRPKSNKIF